MDIFAPECRIPIPAGFVGRLLHHLGNPAGAAEAIRSAAEETELSEWDAADIALVGRPYLAAAMERGEIPHTVTPYGGTWIVRLSDLLTWMHADDAKRQAAADELTRLTQDEPDDDSPALLGINLDKEH